MNNLVIDLTHGGVKLAASLAKKGENVYAYDLYNTLKDDDLNLLNSYGVELIQLEDLNNFKGDLNVIYPVHMPMGFDEITSCNPKLNYTFMTHHECVKWLLSGWAGDIPKVEITGVKGKTTSVFMLKEILIRRNPLILSSLGAMLFEGTKKFVLKRNISITPANIKETVDLAYKISNPVCEIAEGKVENENLKKYSSAIFESSLGASGIGDVGLLLNIAEDYPIAKGRSSASTAKRQVFRCGCVCIEKEAFDAYYSDVKHSKVNTFSLDDKKANLYLKNADYSLDKTAAEIEYRDVKTINGNLISGKLELETFAPGKHHLSNLLGVVLTALSLEIPPEEIKENLKNFKGIAGRSSKKEIENSTVIEEINPGLNTEAIKQSINMISDLDDYYISIGGDYGITCEEIDEDKLCDFLEKLENDLILTGPVGSSISKKLTKDHQFIKNPLDVYDLAIKNRKNLLFIYRSDYRKVNFR